MKTILVLAAAIGLTVSAASAECMGHSKVNASIDTETKVASVSTADTSTATVPQTVKQQETKAQ
ncbi:hypothetical protein [Mesorhizobium sp. DCY119]|uniref:hypothetical protein n=1 Tax=Mesorhizobium sp. DCY119 TaxID=2108445 RepID=UPI000E6BF6ED|nr:hypothetical protein [Mesorhizobium sp. DCY119]RJG46318.1 hypothetical protein D3Y55_20130 [Mesorhizobium sp. DCY119]